MKKLFTVIRQGKLDEVKSIIEKRPSLLTAFLEHCRGRITDSLHFKCLQAFYNGENGNRR